MTPSRNMAPRWATSPASHTSGSAACLVTFPSYPVAALPKGSPYSSGEKDISGMRPPLYEHVALCSGSTSPWCFRESGLKHKSGEGAPHHAAGGGGHCWTSPVAVKRGCVAGPAPAVFSAPGLPRTQKPSSALMEATPASPPEQAWPHPTHRTDSVCTRGGTVLTVQEGKGSPHPARLASPSLLAPRTAGPGSQSLRCRVSRT